MHQNLTLHHKENKNRITLLKHSSQCRIGVSRKIKHNVFGFMEWSRDFLRIIHPIEWKVDNQNLCMVHSWFNNTKDEEVNG
jgi:hypothetical protein